MSHPIDQIKQAYPFSPCSTCAKATWIYQLDSPIVHCAIFQEFVSFEHFYLCQGNLDHKGISVFTLFTKRKNHKTGENESNSHTFETSFSGVNVFSSSYHLIKSLLQEHDQVEFHECHYFGVIVPQNRDNKDSIMDKIRKLRTSSQPEMIMDKIEFERFDRS